MSNFGKGIPIYVDLRGVTDIPVECYPSNAPIRGDPRLGITIGVLLSVLCILACAFIIVRHRRCSKSPHHHHQHVNGNGGNALGSFQNRSPLNRGSAAGPTTIISASSAQIPNCNTDAHEMQTLIVPTTIQNVSIMNGNGATQKVDSHMNGAIATATGGNRNSFSTTNTHSTDDDETSDLSRCGLISSTPKSKHKTIISKNDHLKNASTNFANSAALDTAYRRIDYNDLDQCGAELASNLFGNDADQPMKTTLPPNKSVHSILFNTNEIPPIAKRVKDNGNGGGGGGNAKRSSVNMSSNVTMPSILHESQQSLLPTHNATESSSASTSSGCAPIDHHINSTTNCILDASIFDNGGSHSTVENQRYMRSAALV